MRYLKNQKGFSIVMAVVISAFLAILIGTIGYFLGSSAKIQVQTDESAVFSTIESSLLTQVARILSNYANDATTNGCGSTNLTRIQNLLSNITIDSNFSASLVTTLPAAPAGSDAAITATISRCVPMLAPVASNQGQSFRFCLRINDPNKVEPAMTYSLIEIRGSLFRLSDGVFPSTYLDCANFQTQPQTGIVLYYQAYWSLNKSVSGGSTTTASKLHQKRDIFFAPKFQ